MSLLLKEKASVSRDVIAGFLSRYAHRVANDWTIRVLYGEGIGASYEHVRNLIRVEEMEGGMEELHIAKAMVLHEAGHALYTPTETVVEAGRKEESKNGIKNIWNLLEDGRIELLLRQAVKRANALLGTMNEHMYEKIEGEATAWQQVWSAMWELSKLGEIRTRFKKSSDGISGSAIRNIVEGVKPKVAEARYARDPLDVLAGAEDIWEIVKDLIPPGAKDFPGVGEPQLSSDDMPGEGPKIRVDVGGEAIPEGKEEDVTVLGEAEKGGEDREEELLREIEREIEETGRANAEGENGLEKAIRGGKEEYKNRVLRFSAEVVLERPDGDLAEYENVKAVTKPAAKKLKKALKLILLREELDDVRREERRGTVDPPLVYRSVLGEKSIFRNQRAKVNREPCVMVLLDESGSMYTREKHLREAAVALHEALRELGIRHSVMGFDNCGVTDNLRLRAYIKFGERVTRSLSAKLANVRARDNNRDGLAINLAGEYLRAEKNRRKLMVVISDGLPQSIDYWGAGAIEDTRISVKDVERFADVMCIYIGPKSDNHLKKIYSRYVFAEDTETLPSRLTKAIKDYTRGWKK
ncbi:MAG: hypothetical protein KKA28_18825 [Planctomycetes bacterium]|nr:hypothetical protein [Planctomycetota bacterium]